MKKLLKTAILSLLFCANSFALQIVEESTNYQTVDISLRDLNRITCSGGKLSKVIYSKEKGIMIQQVGSDFYVKVIPIEETDPFGRKKIIYKAKPTEVYAYCSGKVFSLILNPKDVPAETIVLKIRKTDRKEAESFEKANPYEETLLKLIKYAYKEDIPPGYTAKEVNRIVKDYRNLEVALKRVYIGDSFRVYEYILTAKSPVNLTEAQFLKLVNSPLAISIVKPSLSKGEVTRLFIVARN